MEYTGKGNLYLAKTDSINKLIQEQKSSTKFKDYDDLTFKLLDNYLGNCYEYKGEYLSNQKRYNQALDAYKMLHLIMESLLFKNQSYKQESKYLLYVS